MTPSKPADERARTLVANRRRNHDGLWWRTPRWRHSRAQLWKLLDGHVPASARVAIVGVGNGHDLPLRRLADRAGELWLFDLDASALERAKRRSRRPDRIAVQQLDVTAGQADGIVAAAIDRHGPPAVEPIPPLPGGPFDVVIADLLYTQLLYPALADNELTGAEINDCPRHHGRPLTDRVVRALHASAPRGIVIHLHDLIGWWPGHPQPASPETIIALSRTDQHAALELAALGDRPLGCDPLPAIAALRADILDTAIWIWPFAPGTDYLVRATVARDETRA